MEKMQTEKVIHGKKTDVDKKLTQMVIPTIFYILKRFSSEENPMQVSEIVEKANALMKGNSAFYSDDFTNVVTDDMVKAKLNLLAELTVSDCPSSNMSEDAKDLEAFKNAMIAAFGGTLVEVSVAGNTVRKKKARCTYYFKPILDEADVNMVCGAIASNRYFSEAEKNFLISSQEVFYGKPIVSGTDAGTDCGPGLFQKPSTQNKKTGLLPPHTTQDMLKIVNTLYYAITNGYQVKVATAQYNVNEKTHHLTFDSTRDGKPYYLHPYALFWNVGQLYLLATFTYKPEQIRHYRVDRIFSAEIVYEKKDGVFTDIPSPTNPLPKALADYRKIQNGRIQKHPGRSGKAVIDTDKYVSTHPLMSIFDESKALLPTVVLECDGPSLPIIIDTFGSSIYVDSSSQHRIDTTDKFGREIKYYTVRLHNIQPDCMTLYCAQHHRSLKVIEPQELKDDVMAILKRSVE